MKTAVYQSYRTTNVPAWIERCLQSVRAWAQMQGFEYAFFDDRFFDSVPMWFREKVQHHVLPMSDLARLLVAKQLFARGFDRVIWVDADVVVFAPQRFILPLEHQYLFCREVWVKPSGTGQWRGIPGVNNAVAMFARDNCLLDFYIHACLTRVRNKPGPIHRLEVGTTLLTTLHNYLLFPLLTTVGLLGPTVLTAIDTADEACLRFCLNQFDSPVFAANLCASLRGVNVNNVVSDDALCARITEQLLATRGEVVNRHWHLAVAAGPTSAGG